MTTIIMGGMIPCSDSRAGAAAGHTKLPAMCPGCRLYKTVSAPLMGSPAAPSTRPTAAARWALLRMHFISFPASARCHTVAQWHDTVARAVAASHEQQHKEAAAEALLFGSPAMKLLAPLPAHISAIATGHEMQVPAWQPAARVVSASA